jgi:hypothetical protein
MSAEAVKVVLGSEVRNQQNPNKTYITTSAEKERKGFVGSGYNVASYFTCMKKGAEQSAPFIS